MKSWMTLSRHHSHLMEAVMQTGPGPYFEKGIPSSGDAPLLSTSSMLPRWLCWALRGKKNVNLPYLPLSSCPSVQNHPPPTLSMRRPLSQPFGLGIDRSPVRVVVESPKSSTIPSTHVLLRLVPS